MVRIDARPRWIVVPDEHRVWLWLDEPPSLFGWTAIEAALHRYVTELRIETLVLAGHGWSAPQTSTMAAALHRDLRRLEIAVEIDTETVPHLCVVDI